MELDGTDRIVDLFVQFFVLEQFAGRALALAQVVADLGQVGGDAVDLLAGASQIPEQALFIVGEGNIHFPDEMIHAVQEPADLAGFSEQRIQVVGDGLQVEERRAQGFLGIFVGNDIVDGIGDLQRALVNFVEFGRDAFQVEGLDDLDLARREGWYLGFSVLNSSL